MVRLLSILFSFHRFKLLTPLPIKVIGIRKTVIMTRANSYCGDSILNAFYVLTNVILKTMSERDPASSLSLKAKSKL